MRRLNFWALLCCAVLFSSCDNGQPPEVDCCERWNDVGEGVEVGRRLHLNDSSYSESTILDVSYTNNAMTSVMGHLCRISPEMKNYNKELDYYDTFEEEFNELCPSEMLTQGQTFLNRLQSIYDGCCFIKEPHDKGDLDAYKEYVACYDYNLLNNACPFTF